MNNAEQVIAERLRQDIRDGKVVTIIGTGVSVATCGTPNRENSVATWVGLLKHGRRHCLELGWINDSVSEAWEALISTQDTSSMVAAAGLITERIREAGEGHFADWLSNTIGRLKVVNHDAISVLDTFPGVLATLNYDGLISRITGREPITWEQENLTGKVLRRERENAVLHLHGHYESPSSIVFGFESYLKNREHPHSRAVRQALAITHTLLFVGCGATFSDPNFDDLIKWGNEVLAKEASPHVVLCADDQLLEFRQRLAHATWLRILPYPGGFDGLAPFLRSIGPSVAQEDLDQEGSSDVFISYAPTDKPLAMQLVSYLKKQNWIIFFDEHASNPISTARIEGERKASKSILILWSSAASSDADILDDIAYASAHGNLVCGLADNSPLPRRLRSCPIANLQVADETISSSALREIGSFIEAIAPRRATRPIDQSIVQVSYEGLDKEIAHNVVASATRLFVGNVPFRIEAEELRALFEEIAPVADFFWPVDRETGRKKGFAFVDVLDSDADRMIEAMNGRHVMGRPLAVNEGRPREDR